MPEIAHYPNRNLKLKGFYLDGDFYGAWDRRGTDGSVMRTGQFDRGKQVGVWRTFDRSGRLDKETDFGMVSPEGLLAAAQYAPDPRPQPADDGSNDQEPRT